MNQDVPQPSFELPAPVSENMEPDSAPMERAPARPEQAPQPAAAPPIASVPTQPLPQALPANKQQLQQSQPANQASPVVADDNDLIEKEWVIKAKQIVAATRDDPHTQSRELSKFKADYLKKRYNKDIKTEDS